MSLGDVAGAFFLLADFSAGQHFPQAFEQVDEEQDFEILGEPDFDPDSVKLPDSGDLTFDYEVEVKPQFELPPLEAIRIEKPIFEVTQHRIDDAVNNLCQRYGQITDITDKPACKDDMLNADVTITIEKVDDPLSLENQSIKVADGGSIESIVVENLEKVPQRKKQPKRIQYPPRPKHPKRIPMLNPKQKRKNPLPKPFKKSPQKTLEKSEKKTDETTKPKTPKKTNRAEVKRKPPGTDIK